MCVSVYVFVFVFVFVFVHVCVRACVLWAGGVEGLQSCRRVYLNIGSSCVCVVRFVSCINLLSFFFFNFFQGSISPMYIACQEGHELAVRALLDAGADSHKPTDEGTTPLMIAYYRDHVHVAKLFGAGTKIFDRPE